MYGGDEINAIVLDVGSYSTKGGYAGEDTPKSDFPSFVGVVHSRGKGDVVGESQKAIGEESDLENTSNGKSNETSNYYLGTNALWKYRDSMEIKNPFEKGLVNDFDVLEQLWNFSFQDQLRIDPKEHPILLAEPSFNTKTIREKYTELMFEKYEIPALFIAKSAVLSSFASGKASSLVIESGASTTTVTPVHDGYVLQKSMSKSLLGGERLTQEYVKIIQENKKVVINPFYTIESKKEFRPGEFEIKLKDLPHSTQSFHQYHVNKIVRDAKESICRVSDSAFDEAANANIPSVPYELPDGNHIEIGTDRFSVPELIFNPEPLNKSQTEGENFLPLQQMVFNSIAKCDPDMRREMFNSIILTGGNCLFPQFAERLHKELMEKAPPQMYKVRIASPASMSERKYSCWIGGSILASLGTFHQMWMSKAEYEEFGRTMVERKCP